MPPTHPRHARPTRPLVPPLTNIHSTELLQLPLHAGHHRAPLQPGDSRQRYDRHSDRNQKLKLQHLPNYIHSILVSDARLRQGNYTPQTPCPAHLCSAPVWNAPSVPVVGTVLRISLSPSLFVRIIVHRLHHAWLVSEAATERLAECRCCSILAITPKCTAYIARVCHGPKWSITVHDSNVSVVVPCSRDPPGGTPRRAPR